MGKIEQERGKSEDIRGHPFMTSTKNQVLIPLPCPHASTWDSLPLGTPSPLWTSKRGRHEIHTTILKRLVQ